MLKIVRSIGLIVKEKNGVLDIPVTKRKE